MRPRLLSLVAGWWAALATAAAGCPVCDTDTGEVVRSGIFNADFFSTAAGIAAPFPVIVAVLLALRFGGKDASREA